MSHDSDLPLHDPPPCPTSTPAAADGGSEECGVQVDVTAEINESSGRSDKSELLACEAEERSCSLDGEVSAEHDASTGKSRPPSSVSSAPSPGAKGRSLLSPASDTSETTGKPLPPEGVGWCEKSHDDKGALSVFTNNVFTSSEPSPESPESAHTHRASSLPSSPTAVGKEGKSDKKKKKKAKKDGSKTDSPKRKRSSGSSKRSRGLSTSSSDDPKSASRSRTESGGSEVLEALDLLPPPDPSHQPHDPLYPTARDGFDEVQGAETLDIQSPELNVSERTLIAEQDNLSGEEKVKSDASRVLFDLQSLTSPVETSSPVSAKKKSKKKKRREREEEGGDNKTKRGGKKRKRGTSTSSSSEEPKSSRSRTESVGSETGSKVQLVTGTSAAEAEGSLGFSFSNPLCEVPCDGGGGGGGDDGGVSGWAPPTSSSTTTAATSAGSNRLECQISVTDYDEDTCKHPEC